MNHIWGSYPYRFNRVYISDECKFIYFTTLKTASKTTRQMVNLKECGFFGRRLKGFTCGNHDCAADDFTKLQNNNSEYFSILFARNPITRFESLYNYGFENPAWNKIQNAAFHQTNMYQYLSNLTNNNFEHIKYLLYIRYFYNQIVNQKEIPDGYMHFVFKHHQPIYLYTCIQPCSKYLNNCPKHGNNTHNLNRSISNNRHNQNKLISKLSNLGAHRKFGNNKFKRIFGRKHKRRFLSINNMSSDQSMNDTKMCYIPTFVGKMEQLVNDMRWIDNENKLNAKIPEKVFHSKHKSKHKYIKHGISYKYINDGLLLLCQLYWNDFMCARYDVPIECQKMNSQQWKYPDFCVNLKDEKIEWPYSNDYTIIEHQYHNDSYMKKIAFKY